MLVLILGLLLFLGTHSVRIVADGWRSRTIARIGPLPWKGAYTLVSLLGFGLIVWGFGLARQQPVVLWQPPVGLKHLNSLFTLLAFVLLAAAYVPGNKIQARLHHPMAAGVKLWAFGHLLATATLADAVLFGTFVLWAVLDFRAARQRDRAQSTVYAPGRWMPTAVTVLVGLLAWGVFAFWLHASWIGMAPFGRTF
ncbi:NnrU family protein [Ottowia sp.]|uniref:NnrU family protein n=1 Tax=Ottowia sp. TaxID=1898956 RepID=UPI003A8B549B